MKRMIIVSPSGNLYGSEQVLLDYLLFTQRNHLIYVPKKSLFEKKLQSLKKHNTIGFKRLHILYFKIIFKLLFFNNNLYINEGGHIRYVKLLARIIPFRKFFIHIRLLDDCNSNRIGVLPRNVKLITVSNYLKKNIDPIYKPIVIYDPYTLKNNHFQQQQSNDSGTIGIVGRITRTKGLDDLIPILECINFELKIIFYGTFNIKDEWTNSFFTTLNDIKHIQYECKGFVEDKSDIYKNINLLVHLNKYEALGRILFEAIDYRIPFIAFNAGGTGELTKLLELNDFIIDDENNWANAFSKKIELFIQHQSKTNISIVNAINIINTKFTYNKYISELENVFDN